MDRSSGPLASRRHRRTQRRFSRIRRIALIAGVLSGASVAWSQIRERRPALAAARRAYLQARRAQAAERRAAVAEVPVEAQQPVVDSTVEPVGEPPATVEPPAAPPTGPQATVEFVAQSGATVEQVPEPEAAGARAGAPSLALQIVIPLALIALAVAAFLLARADWSSPIRSIVVVAFVIVGPGWAILHLTGQSSGWLGASLVVALSVSLAVLVCIVMLGTGTWSPLGWLGVLAGATVVVSLVALVRGVSGRRHTAATMASAPT